MSGRLARAVAAFMLASLSGFLFAMPPLCAQTTGSAPPKETIEADVSTRTYPAAHTGAQMFSVQMIVNVPSRLHLAHLREEFMEFCDSLNLDAIMEPVKS